LGMPVRITRRLRYSLYRASDGAWYLGQRDWNATTLRFNTIQPVSGPFLSAALGGLTFRYFDSSGVEVPSGAAQTRAIALLRITARGETQRTTRIEGQSTNARGRHGDSALVTVL